jgi:hypothetical protein|tara:strand:- start:988 stop:1389 length:402 start_codon:yes stop_codon:yes gene_type:complete
MIPKETSKLIVGVDGVLQETGTKEVSVAEYKELVVLDYQPMNDWLVLQPLPAKELKSTSGLIVSAGKMEFKAAIVAAPKESEYVRGQVVRIDPMMFGNEGPKVDYIEGKPVLDCPVHFVKGVYTNVNLSDWKA